MVCVSHFKQITIYCLCHIMATFFVSQTLLKTATNALHRHRLKRRKPNQSFFFKKEQSILNIRIIWSVIVRVYVAESKQPSNNELRLRIDKSVHGAKRSWYSMFNSLSITFSITTQWLGDKHLRRYESSSVFVRKYCQSFKAWWRALKPFLALNQRRILLELIQKNLTGLWRAKLGDLKEGGY